MRASELRISSDRPSEKNTLSLSSDRFSNGSTAMDLAGMAVTADAGTELLVAVVVDANSGAPCAAGIAEVAVTPWLVGAPATFHKNPPPTASTSATSSNSVPLARCRPWSPWYQASNSVTRKPTQIAMINRRSTVSGQPNLAATMSMRCCSRAMKSVMALSAFGIRCNATGWLDKSRHRLRVGGGWQADFFAEHREARVMLVAQDQRIEQQQFDAGIAVGHGTIQPLEHVVGIFPHRVYLGDLVGRGTGIFVDRVLQRGVCRGAITPDLQSQRHREIMPLSGRGLLRRGQRRNGVATQHLDKCQIRVGTARTRRQFDGLA